MKTFIQSVFRAFFSAAAVFFLTILCGFLLETCLHGGSFQQGLHLLVFSETEVVLYFSLLCGVLVFLFSLFRKHPALLSLVSVLFLVFCTSWIVLQIPDLHEKLELQNSETLKKLAVEEAQANIYYENAQVYQYENLPPIQVLSSEEKDGIWLDDIVENAVRKMPPFLLDKCSTLVFMDEEHFLQEEMDGSLSNVVGLANSADMSVKVLIQDFDTQYVDKSMPEWIMDPIDYYINTISHELGHLWDYQEPYSQVFLSDSEQVQNLYEQYGLAINDYASSNVHEFFAECAKLYYFYPGYLYQKSPDVWQYFDELNLQYNI